MAADGDEATARMQDEMLASFQAITGVEDQALCRNLLEAYAWNVEAAASHHFDEPGGLAAQQPAGGEMPPLAGGGVAPAPMPARPPERLVDPFAMDDGADLDDDDDDDYDPMRRAIDQVRPATGRAQDGRAGTPGMAVRPMAFRLHLMMSYTSIVTIGRFRSYIFIYIYTTRSPAAIRSRRHRRGAWRVRARPL